MSHAFFFDHAGWGYKPGEETPEQGRDRGAELLVKAEIWAKETDLRFVWESDWGIGSHVKEFDAYDEEPQTCESCIVYDADGFVVASLSCIDDADADYRRVVEAELALEVMPS